LRPCVTRVVYEIKSGRRHAWSRMRDGPRVSRRVHAGDDLALPAATLFLPATGAPRGLAAATGASRRSRHVVRVAGGALHDDVDDPLERDAGDKRPPALAAVVRDVILRSFEEPRTFPADTFEDGRRIRCRLGDEPQGHVPRDRRLPCSHERSVALLEQPPGPAWARFVGIYLCHHRLRLAAHD
jgi:hypothetical protein